MYLTRDKISAHEFLSRDGDFAAGAGVLFFGMIRNHSSSSSQKVLYLEYESYESMAEQLIGELIVKAYENWPLEKIKILHRLGRVGLGEIAVAIEVKAAHRDEAYQASRFLIEEIKHRVPVWKKEYFEDGTHAWGMCRHQGVVSC